MNRNALLASLLMVNLVMGAGCSEDFTYKERVAGEWHATFLEANNAEEKMEALDAVKQIGIAKEKSFWSQGDEEARILISAAMENGNKKVRLLALFNLNDVGYMDDQILIGLKSLLESSDSSIRQRALMPLANADPQVVVPIAIRFLADQDGEMRRSAARLLLRIGPEARQAIPTLRKIVESGDEDATAPAIKALAAIEGRPISEIEKLKPIRK